MASEPRHIICITGGSGFVGGLLVQYLRQTLPADALEIVNLGRGNGSGLDITDRAAVFSAIGKARPTAVVHLAAVAAPAAAKIDPHHAWDVNLTGSMHLAEAVLSLAPEARFVHVGSSEAYGASFVGADRPLTEDAALRPLSVYGATKAAADIMIGQMAVDGLRAVRFRPFNHTGPGQADAYVVSAFAKQVAEIMAGRRPPVISVGNLDAERDFLDARDIVRAYAFAALNELPQSHDLLFNLASGQPRRIASVLEALIEASQREIEVVVDPERVRANDVPVTAGDAGSARRVLGWAPEIAFEKTLSDVLGHWSAQM